MYLILAGKVQDLVGIFGHRRLSIRRLSRADLAARGLISMRHCRVMRGYHAGHIAVATSDLAGGASDPAFAQALSLVGGVEIVEVDATQSRVPAKTSECSRAFKRDLRFKTRFQQEMSRHDGESKRSSVRIASRTSLAA
jgi:hypothetical protein